MLKSFTKCIKISPKIIRSFSTTAVVDIYPDQIVQNLKLNINKQEDILSIESAILDNLHFFDADQFVDIVSILAYANKGTEGLWDMLSRKIFDYELDLIQTYMLDEALRQCNKADYFMDDQIARDVLVHEVKWPKQSALFKNKLL